MGRVRYGLWWLDQATVGVRNRARAVTGGTAAVGRELRWAAELSARSTLAGVDHVRPEPWSDRGLLWLFGGISIAAVAVAVLLGFGMAHWAMTSSGATLFAAAGAVGVGVVLLPLAYLVFASKRRGRR